MARNASCGDQPWTATNLLACSERLIPAKPPAQIFSKPDFAAVQAGMCVQEQALRILVAAADGKIKVNRGATLQHKLLPACLAALSAPAQAVRQQALAFCSAAASSETSSYFPADDSIGKKSMKELTNAILVHATAITADAAAAIAVFRQAHATSGQHKKASPARYAVHDAQKLPFHLPAGWDQLSSSLASATHSICMHRSLIDNSCRMHIATFRQYCLSVCRQDLAGLNISCHDK